MLALMVAGYAGGGADGARLMALHWTIAVFSAFQ